MKKIYFKELTSFQGKKYLNRRKVYFEGWYYKQSSDTASLAIIPGINIEGKIKKAFIQIITEDTSYYINYKIKDFHYQKNPFQIQIGKNIFSENQVHLDIKDEQQNLTVEGHMFYSHSEMIHQNIIKPNIMGPFTYLPFLECNHAIISMKNSATGIIKINEQELRLTNGVGYIEKDWGCSFPKKYIWCQGNQFFNKDASFMLAIAEVPLKIFTLKGLICSLKLSKKEYLFTTYNFAKIKKCQIDKGKINIILKKGKYTLQIHSKEKESQKLLAPEKGKMNREIKESIIASIEVTLKRKKEIIFSDICTTCGLEMVN